MKTCPTCKSNHSDHYSHCPLDGTPLVEASLWTEGAVIRGKYRILGKIGQGGMGAVYKAQRVRFKELCAIKVMASELMKHPVFLKRFEHEAVLTRKLQHPNAVRVEDFDEAEDGRPFIIMEYIEGRSLKEVIAQEAPLPVPLACSIAKQVASALDAAHRLGIVHRDIKPDNIVLLDSSITQSPNHSMAKVLDFGIAKMKEGLLETTGIGMTLTGTGMAIGTPSYMSPEQALGKKGDELDGRSDIYSLGVVMYQMLTGELPLKAETPIQMMMAHIQTPPQPLRETRHGAQIPKAISDLVMQCLEKGQEWRPASAQAVVDGLVRAGASPPAGPNALVSDQSGRQGWRAQNLGDWWHSKLAARRGTNIWLSLFVLLSTYGMAFGVWPVLGCLGFDAQNNMGQDSATFVWRFIPGPLRPTPAVPFNAFFYVFNLRWLTGIGPLLERRYGLDPVSSFIPIANILVGLGCVWASSSLFRSNASAHSVPRIRAATLIWLAWMGVTMVFVANGFGIQLREFGVPFVPIALTGVSSTFLTIILADRVRASRVLIRAFPVALAFALLLGFRGIGIPIPANIGP
jgi:serine/threonine protein kinase